MTKTYLKDVTFIIPVRIDSKERHENLKAVLNLIHTNFHTNVNVLEADKFSGLIDLKMQRTFVVDTDPVFHRTKYINELASRSTTPILAIWDTDVLIKPEQIIEGVERIRNNQDHFVIPYNGSCYFIEKLLSKEFRLIMDFDILENNINKHQLYQTRAVGGAFIVNRKKYIETGMENENFYGWGPEDMERVKRWEIFGYDFKWISGPAFHLYHPRGMNSSFHSERNKIQLKKEYLKICSMNYKSLQNYINNWEHVIQIKEIN